MTTRTYTHQSGWEPITVTDVDGLLAQREPRPERQSLVDRSAARERKRKERKNKDRNRK